MHVCVCECTCKCVNVCSALHFQRSEFYFSGNLSYFCILEMNFAGAFGALQHRLLRRPGWVFLCRDRQALPCLVGSWSLHFAVSLSHVAMSCVRCWGGHKGIKPGTFAQVLAALSAGAVGHQGLGSLLGRPRPRGVCGQPSCSTQRLVQTNVTWLVVVLRNLKYNKSLLSFSLTPLSFCSLPCS